MLSLAVTLVRYLKQLNNLMKVFFILDNAFPSNNPSAKRVKCYCKGLNYYGVETEILTISQKGNPEECEGLLYRKIGKGHNGSIFSKIRALLYNLRELRLYIKSNAKVDDIIYLYSDGHIVGYLPYILGKTRKYVRELCEIPFYSDHILAKIQRWFYFRIPFLKYDGIVAISQSLQEIALRHKSNKARIVKIPIIVDNRKHMKIEDNEESLSMIFHSGSHTEAKDGFLGMISSIGIVKERYNINVDFYCTGSEPSSDEYKSLVKKYSLANNIRFLGYISEEDLFNWQRKSKLFIINKYDSFQNRFCFATKLGEYLAVGRPVITTNIGEAMHYLSDGKNAIVVKAGDPNIIAEKIADVFNNPLKYKKVGSCGRNLALNEFDCIKNGLKLKAFLEQLR